MSGTPTVVQLTRGGEDIHPESGPITAHELVAAGVLGLSDRQPLLTGLYLHVPFCFHKCHYCDFYSIVDTRDRRGAFAKRMIEEIRASAEMGVGGESAPIETIFIGGGTPTLLSPAQLEMLLSALHDHFRIQAGVELTVEANPETVTPELASTLAAGGVNRVSIGAQSFNIAHLKTLERHHDPRNVGRSVEVLRRAGIENINLDLIFAVPGQSRDEWMADLDAAMALHPEHLSCYSLMYEPNTALTMKLRSGAIERVDEDLEAAMYLAAIDRLGDAGFEHYEISAWAKYGGRSSTPSSHRCRHNLRYWTNGNWWPLGPSASGHVNGTRWKNVPRLGSYLDQSPLPPVADVEQLDEDGVVGETLMLGLRLIDGLPMEQVRELLSRGQRGTERSAAIERHVDAGSLEEASNHLRLTRRGLLLADDVLADLV